MGHKSFGGHKHFHKVSGGFVVKHYAGDVGYNVSGFGDSNKDALDKDLILLMQSGEGGELASQLLPTLFPEEVDMNDKRMPKTGGFKIRTQCGQLVAALRECNPHYVRCVKPNDQKKALHSDVDRVSHQVKYLGLLENIRVRRAGFAYRAEFHRFVERFELLAPVFHQLSIIS